MEKNFSIPQADPTPSFGTLLRQVLNDKNITFRELAGKLQISEDELIDCSIKSTGAIPSRDTLKKISGILGIRYTTLLVSAGYNAMNVHSDFYLPDGTAIDIKEADIEKMIDRLYYTSPTLLSRLPLLFELLFND